MNIQDYGLWFVFDDKELWCDAPHEIIRILQKTPLAKTLVDAKSDEAINFNMRATYNGDFLPSLFKGKYFPTRRSITIEVKALPSFINHKAFDSIVELFDIMHVPKAKNNLTSTLILNYVQRV